MRIRKGQTVRVDFMDHAVNSPPPLEFSVFGRIAHVDKKTLCVDGWCFTDPAIPYNKDFVERHTIVRAAITRIAQLQEVR